MVLEHIVPESWLERKAYFAFILGAAYSTIGIILARLLFAKDPAIPAVAFTSLLLLPELYKIFAIEEEEQKKDKDSDIRAFWRDNGDFFRVFLFLFLGILVVYSIAGIALQSFSVNTLFREQLAMRNMPGFGAAGMAIATTTAQDLFFRLLWNNALVLVAILIVAFLAGDGAIFLITWNASVWGTIFGVTARNAALISNGDPFVVFMQVIFIVTPHVLLEASAYILAAMAGGLISRSVVVDGIGSAGLREVLEDNATIIGLSIACLVVGAVVETFVLKTSTTYARIIALSVSAVH